MRTLAANVKQPSLSTIMTAGHRQLIGVRQWGQEGRGIGGRITDQQASGVQIDLAALGGRAGTADCQNLRRWQWRPGCAMRRDRLRHRLTALGQCGELPAKSALAQAGTYLREDAKSVDRPAARRQHATPRDEQLTTVG